MLACLSCLAQQSPPAVLPGVQAGVLDLREWKPENGPVALDGEWRFSWMEMSSGQAPVTEHRFPVPGFWNGQKLGNQTLTPAGYATYSLKILGAPATPLALHLVDMESAYTLYANGTVIATNGRVGRSVEEEIPEWRPQVVLLSASGDIDLVLVVSNFHHRLGGVWQGIKLGSAAELFETQRKTVALEIFLAASLAMIAIYHWLVFSVRRQEKSFLLLGWFTIIMALRSLVTGERFLVTMFPALTWDVLIRLDYLTVSIGFIFCHWYLRTIFQAYYHRFALIGLVCLLVPTALAELILPPRIFSFLLPVHMFTVFAWSLYFLGINFWAIRRGMPGAAVLFVGWLISIVASTYDSLYIQSVLGSRYMFALGLQAFVLTQSYYLASQYARAFALSETLAERMQSLLALTRELNRSGVRDSAIWTAIHEIKKITRNPITEAVAYVPTRDSRYLQKIRPQNTGLEPVSPDVSETLVALSGIEANGPRIRIPVRTPETLLCVLEMHMDAGGNLSSFDYERPYLDGIMDSLRLVLDNIHRVQTDELARIGQTAAEIVHDITHHCHVIGTHTRAALVESPGQKDAIRDIDREVFYMKNLAYDILDYARERLVVYPRLHQMKEVSDTIKEDLAETFRDTEITHTTKQFSDGAIRIDLERFRRVVLNLARNAITALGGRGHFSVMIEEQVGSWCFVFEDDGPGVSAELVNRLFEPFASGGRGTGLGLAVVKRIVEAHGGTVRVRSEPGKGCRFLVELPASAPNELQ